MVEGRVTLITLTYPEVNLIITGFLGCLKCLLKPSNSFPLSLEFIFPLGNASIRVANFRASHVPKGGLEQ